MKTKFVVTIARTEVVCKEIEVEATTEKEAKTLAIDEAADHEFGRAGDATYDAVLIKKI